jgi:hypothetical protein
MPSHCAVMMLMQLCMAFMHIAKPMADLSMTHRVLTKYLQVCYWQTT